MSPQILPLSAAAQIADYAIQPPGKPHMQIELTQATHRIHLINAWAPAIHAGARVLELGCGQGTATQAIAEAVGPDGHIDALDPASLDYGTPYNLGQAQAHLSQGPIGSRITWHQAETGTFLAAHPDKTWDVAVLAHCIWYFKSPAELAKTLVALKGRVKTVLIAEYALAATEKAAFPHVLAALARAAFEAHQTGGQANITTPLGPAGIKEVAEAAGWAVKKESVVVPEQGLDDGRWEIGDVASKSFLKQIEESVPQEGIRVMLRSAREAVLAALKAVGGQVKNAQTMDVWVASLEAADV